MATVTVTDQHQDGVPEEAESGGRTFDNDRGVTTTDVDNVRSSADSSTPGGQGCGANAICVRSEFDVDKLEHEDGGSTSFARYSDDDSVEGDELGLCNNFDNGDLLPGSEVPMFGHVCVKDSSILHFGKTNVYNDGVIIRKFYYTNTESVGRSDDVPEEEDAGSDCGGRRNETVNSLDTRVHRKVKKWLFCGMGSFLLIAVVVCMILFIPKQAEPLVEQIPLGPNGSSWIITRAGWDSWDQTEPVIKLKLPVPFLIVSNTKTDPCGKLSECKTRVRIIHTSKYLGANGYSDIAFNFLIGGDGNVYEGRGWDVVGAHAKTYNDKSIGISFIGTFDTDGPPEKQLLAAQQLIDLGVKENKLASNYTLLGHRQIKDDGDPGDALYNIIKTMPHWKPSP